MKVISKTALSTAKAVCNMLTEYQAMKETGAITKQKAKEYRWMSLATNMKVAFQET